MKIFNRTKYYIVSFTVKDKEEEILLGECVISTNDAFMCRNDIMNVLKKDRYNDLKFININMIYKISKKHYKIWTRGHNN